MRTVIALLGLVLAIGACVESQLVPCGTAWCGTADVCHQNACEPRSDVLACASQPEFGVCTRGGQAGACRSGVCRTIRCGDGWVGTAEVCDDGNLSDGDGCSATCLSNERCGNGLRDLNEECDDGNTADSDACHSTCRLPRCGDGMHDPQLDEACDDGNLNDGDGCAANCGSTERCGNGIWDKATGEACDDGNLLDGDGCNAHCALGSCGDGVRDLGEACDDGNLLDGDGCNARCTSTEACGNGILDQGTAEQCDDGNTQNGDNCSAGCQLPYCGDGIRDRDEACDDGNNVDGDGCAARCQSDEACGNGLVDFAAGEACDEGQLNGDAPGSPCRANCQLPRCGDAIRDGDERCDDGNTQDGDGCSATCLSDETCGNGIIDGPIYEQCDEGPSGQHLSGDGCSSTCLAELPLWERGAEARLPMVSRASLARAADRLILYGGAMGASHSADTWELADHVWRKLRTYGEPPAVIDAVLFDDPGGQGLMLFGGAQQDGSLPSSMWRFKAPQWERLETQSLPPRRRLAAVAQHGTTVVLFGGLDTAGAPLGDTWLWANGRWSQYQGPGPSPRAGATMTHSTQGAVLFGGADASGVTANDTWRFDGAWHLLATTGAPPPRTRAAMTTLADGDLLLIGGLADGADENALVDDAWLLRDTAWTPASLFPLATHVHMATTTSGATFGLGVQPGDAGATFEYTDDTWVEVPMLAMNPPFLLAAAPERGLLYNFDQSAGFQAGEPTQLWAYDGAGWRRELPATSLRPPSTNEAALAYDPQRGILVVFGGTDPDTWELRPNVTWEWDGQRWRKATSATKPAPRAGHAMVYDAAAGGVLLHGGYVDVAGEDVISDETWLLTTQGWRRYAQGPARTAHAMAFDARHARTILFGGDIEGNDVDRWGQTETWELTNGQWRQLEIETPIGRSGARLAYHASRGSIILWGGYLGGGRFSLTNETWELVDNHWREITSPATPGLPFEPGLAAYEDSVFLLQYESEPADRPTAWRLNYRSLSAPVEQCHLGRDADLDGLSGCQDPDCWASCYPRCAPYTIADWPAACPRNVPHCGDGTCNASLESPAGCPVDCEAP